MLEAEKYAAAWDLPDYRKFSPAEHFLSAFPGEAGESVIDFGCGTGRATLELHRRGMDVRLVDLAPNCLDDDVRAELGDRLEVGNLWDYDGAADWAVCCDVMEHLPTEYVMAAILNIGRICDQGWFTICNKEDHFGESIGETLHLTVKPYSWWLERMNEVSTVIESRDLLTDSMFHVRF